MAEKPLDPEELKKFPRKPGYRYGLSEIEEKYARGFVESGGKNTPASEAAGISPGHGLRLKHKAGVRQRIRLLQAEAAERNDISVNWVVGKYKQVVEKGLELGDLRAANGALEGLGKYLGMFQRDEASTEVKIMGFFTHNDQGDMVRLARAAGFELEERANPPREAEIIDVEAETIENDAGTEEETLRSSNPPSTE